MALIYFTCCADTQSLPSSLQLLSLCFHSETRATLSYFKGKVMRAECTYLLLYIPHSFYLFFGLKGRLHAFRKLETRPLPPNDCHSKLRAEIVGSSTTEILCVSVAWDWMYRGVTSQGMNREIVASLECAALNRRYGVQSLAIPELSLLQMARTLVPEEREAKSGEVESFLSFRNESTATEAKQRFHPAAEVVCRGIFPALQYIVKQQLDSIRSAESQESRSNERCKRVSIAKRPNSWENPLSTTVDPYGESDFFCKLCKFFFHFPPLTFELEVHGTRVDTDT